MGNGRSELTEQAQCVKHACRRFTKLLPRAYVVGCLTPERDRLNVLKQLYFKNI